MDVNTMRKNLYNFFNKAYKQFLRDEGCYYPDKIGYNTELLLLCSEKQDLLEVVLFDFFEDIKRSTFIVPFELNVMIENAISVYMSSIKFFTNKMMYLTWRPAEEMSMDSFKIIVKNLIEKKIINNYVLVFEQKGKDYSNIGKGKHIHMLIKFKYNRNYTEYKKQIKRYFYETHKQHKRSVEILDIDKTEFIKSKLYYMGYIYENGELTVNENLNYKKGESIESTKEKIECLKYDRLFQRNENLNDIIENSINL